MPSPATQDTSTSSAPSPESPGPREQFRALLSGCAFAPLRATVLLSLTGSDRVRWLNGMTTNNVRDLAAGFGVYGFVLNPQGQIQGDGYTYHRGESLVFETTSDQLSKLKAVFDHFIIMDDVEVSDLPLSVFALIGPGSRQALAGIGITAPEMKPLQVAEVPWRETTITLVRTDEPVSEGYQLWTSHEIADQLYAALRASGLPELAPATLELWRIALGRPRYGQDIRERDLPQETEQARALNFNKGCYIGQEIVERIRSRGSVHRKFSGFEVEGPLPAPGARIATDGKDVGEITSVAMVPAADGEVGVALGYIRREHSVPGKRLQAAGATVMVADLPFRKIFQE